MSPGHQAGGLQRWCKVGPQGLLEDTPQFQMGLWRPGTGGLPHCSGETEAQRGCPGPRQESCHSRDRVPGRAPWPVADRAVALPFSRGQGDSGSWRGGAPGRRRGGLFGRRGGRHLAGGWEWGAPGGGLGDLLAAGKGWGPPSWEHGGLPPGRPPRRAARLISMGEGRWRGGAAGRAGTSLAGPAGPAETQSASDGGGARPFTRRGGPGAGGEEFPPPGRRIAPGPGGARPPSAPDLEPL